MKKKFTILVLALTGAVFCAIGLAACNDDGGKDVIGVKIASVQNPNDKKSEFSIGNFVYGEDGEIKENLKGLKFYKEFGNGSYAEVAESELQIKYEKDNEILSAKPETFSPSKSGGAVGSYRFTYSFADATNTAYVTFQVDRAKSSEFTATLSQSTWHFGDKTATITLKNPAGTTMKLSQSYYDRLRRQRIQRFVSVRHDKVLL